MANEIKVEYTTSAAVYVVITSATGQRWYTVTPTFEPESDGHWTSYAITLTEQGTTGTYFGTFPAGITTPGRYVLTAYLRAGGSAAITDTKLGIENLDWSGNAVVSQTGDSFALIGTAGVGLTAVSDTSGTTTLLSRLTGTRATNLDRLDASVSSVAASVWTTLTSSISTSGSFGLKIKNWVLGTDNKALISTDAGNGGPLYDLLVADRYIDKTTDPTAWALVLFKKGTGLLGVGTELLRQPLYDVNGVALNSTTTVIGRSVAP